MPAALTQLLAGLRTRTRRGHWLLPMLALAMPLFLCFAYTCVFPRADHWGMVIAPYLKLRSGIPWWEIAHCQFNDSRMDVQVAFHLALLSFTRWDLHIESLVSVLMGGAAVLVLLRQLRELPAQCGRDAWTMVIPWVAAFWLLSPRQWMNWTWGVQICYTIVVAGTMATIATLRCSWPRPLRLGTAMLCAGISCLTFINGWMAWILGTGWLLWEWWQAGLKHRAAALATAAWIAAAGAVAWFSFSGYESKDTAGEGLGLAARFLARPMDFLLYFLHVLGAPFSDVLPTWDRDEFRYGINLWASTAYACAALLIGLALFVHGLRGGWRGKARVVSLWWLLAAWGLGSALAIAIARTGVTASNPWESRYGAFTLWYHVAVLGLCAHAGEGWARKLRWVWLALLTWGAVSSALLGLRDVRWDYDRNRMLSSAAMMRHVAPDPVLLSSLAWGHPSAFVADTLDILEADGKLAVPALRDPSPSAARQGRDAKGMLERATLQPGKLSLKGWAIYRSSDDAVDGVAISAQPDGGEERWIGVAQHRGRREKVARKMKSTAQHERIGWEYVHGPSPASGPGAGETPPALPSGPVVFRAYALDLDRGMVHPLPGAKSLDLPAATTSP